MTPEGSFLGTGWSFPPEFGRGGIGVKLVAGEADIVQSLGIILSTTLGERIMHPDFGCDLSRFVFRELDQDMINGIKAAVSDAILRHETRITINDIEVTESSTETGMLLVNIDYTVITTNSRYNMVYPFYINETRSAVPVTEMQGAAENA